MNTCYSFLYDVLVLESVVVGVAFSVNIVIPVLVHISTEIYICLQIAHYLLYLCLIYSFHTLTYAHMHSHLSLQNIVMLHEVHC